MSDLSLDYEAFLASLNQLPQPAELGATLANAAADRYQAEHEGACALFEFEQIGATYWFDFASSAALPQEDRTIAARAITPTDVRRRDVDYQRGFPMAPDDESAVDRGHLIPICPAVSFDRADVAPWRADRAVSGELTIEADLALVEPDRVDGCAHFRVAGRELGQQ